ncbi:hypothetical protein [Desulfurivibrio alkaliphilus]|uniref:Uncharacterized protein n=1 Tax=Desulfurivibrio alkaliphilus (strain DSM 19089 / UNIQEM U267 / AHT2) TaxID=589865 RepID=D6Z658_DESAT|nr:hypothetical protein [Desulfurivibrio alkaliphilus]ADH86823.1 hypothetical protein DaAHT2_2154 [Desulfurivibrio alkaliphilus AHT 2]
MPRKREPRKLLSGELAAKVEAAADTMPADIAYRLKDVILDEMEAEQASPWIASYLEDVLRADYEKTRNPLIAWHAYHHARALRKPVPEWVLEYLDKSAKRLLNPDNQPKDIPALLGFMRANSLGGGAQAFKQWETYYIQLIAVLILSHIMGSNPDMSIEKACELTEPFVEKMSKGRITADMFTIKKWYYQFTNP